MSIWKPRSQRTICSDKKWGESEKLLAAPREGAGLAGCVSMPQSVAGHPPSQGSFPGLGRIPPQSVPREAMLQTGSCMWTRPTLFWPAAAHIWWEVCPSTGSRTNRLHLETRRRVETNISKFSVLYTQNSLGRSPCNSLER